MIYRIIMLIEKKDLYSYSYHERKDKKREKKKVRENRKQKDNEWSTIDK